MKVLFISNDPSIFDVGSAARARMRAYAAVIGELHIVSAANSGARSLQEGGLFLHPVRAPRLFRIFVLAWRARRIIRQHGIEVVSAQDPFEHGLAALWAVRGTRAKLHVQVHTDFLSPWFGRGSLLNRLRCRIADRVLPQTQGVRAVSERIKASLVARYGSRVPAPSVVPLTVGATLPAPTPLPAHSFTFALIVVGRLEKEKRVEDILAALKLVRARYPVAGLIIIGDGRERTRLEHMIRDLGLTGHVLLCGARADARALLANAQVFVQAGAYEGYGRTLVEAALARVPIVTTDVGVVGEVLKPEEDVLVVPVGDSAALARAVIRLIEDNALRLQLVIHAEMTARTHLAAHGVLAEETRADFARLLS